MNDSDHKLLYNAISNAVQVYKCSYDWITKDMLKSCLRRKYAKHKASLNPHHIESTSATTSSTDTLTNTRTSTPCSTSTANNDQKREEGRWEVTKSHSHILKGVNMRQRWRLLIYINKLRS
jgi:hypothetical protein